MHDGSGTETSACMQSQVKTNGGGCQSHGVECCQHVFIIVSDFVFLLSFHGIFSWHCCDGGEKKVRKEMPMRRACHLMQGHISDKRKEEEEKTRTRDRKRERETPGERKYNARNIGEISGKTCKL